MVEHEQSVRTSNLDYFCRPYQRMARNIFGMNSLRDSLGLPDAEYAVVTDLLASKFCDQKIMPCTVESGEVQLSIPYYASLLEYLGDPLVESLHTLEKAGKWLRQKAQDAYATGLANIPKQARVDLSVDIVVEAQQRAEDLAIEQSLIDMRRISQEIADDDNDLIAEIARKKGEFHDFQKLQIAANLFYDAWSQADNPEEYENAKRAAIKILQEQYGFVSKPSLAEAFSHIFVRFVQPKI